MLNVIRERKFIKDVELAEKRGKNLAKLKEIMQMIVNEKPLPRKNLNHKLKGDYKDCWECHIEPDWLLIYKKYKDSIAFMRTGTHSDLFK